MKKLFTYLLFVFLIIGKLHAQQIICGEIKDSISNFKLPNSSVTLFDFSGNKVISTASDSLGYFSIKVDENNKLQYKLAVSNVGYTSKFVVINDETLRDTITILMSRQTNNLDEVEVLGEKKILEFSSGHIIYNVSKSPTAVGGNAYDALLKVPGVYEMNHSLYFRTKNITVQIDGRNTNLSGEALKTYLSTLPSSLINKIDVIPNPSAKYSSDAGSVANIILIRNNSKQGLSGKLWGNIGKGVQFRHNEGLQLDLGNEKLKVYASYDYNHNQQYFKVNQDIILQNGTHIIQNNFENRVRNIHTIRLGVDYNISSKIKTGIQIRSLNNIGSRSVVNTANENINSTVLSLTNSNVRISNPYVNFYTDFDIDDLGKKLSVNVDYFTQQQSWNDSISIFSTNNSFLNGNQPVSVSLKSISLDYVNPFVIGKIEAGIKIQSTDNKNDPIWESRNQFSGWSVDPSRTYNFLFTENIYNAYLSWYTSIGKHMSGNAGVRTEYLQLIGKLDNPKNINSRNLYYIFPHLNLNYKPNDKNAVDFNYKKNINRFSFNVVNPFRSYISPYFISIGNPSITPQVNHDMDLTYIYKQALSFGLSYTLTKNVISPINTKDTDGNTLTTYSNLPNAQLFYIYANVPYQILKWLTINFSGGYGYLKYTTNVSQDYHISNKTWSYLFQLGAYISVTKGFDIEINSYSRGPYATGIYKSKGVTGVGVGVKKSLIKDKLDCSFALSDVFNSVNERQQTNFNNINIQSYNKIESQFLTFGLNYNFGKKQTNKNDNGDTKLKEINKRF